MWEPVAVAILVPLVWMALDRAVPGVVATQLESWFGVPMLPDRTSSLVGLGVGVLASIGPFWKLTRYLGTYAHEIGHATIGALIGANLDDVRIHADSSGLAVYRIPASWGRLRHCMVAAAGYPAPGIVGCATIAAAVAGYGRAWLAYMTIVIATVVALQVRNLWGVISGLGIVAAGYAISRLPVSEVVVAMTLAVGAVLNIAGIRQARVLARSLPHVGDSDAHQLRIWGRLPTRFWSLAFTVSALGTAWLSLRRIAPTLDLDGLPSPLDLGGIVADLRGRLGVGDGDLTT